MKLKSLLATAVLGTALLFCSVDAGAQCAMCRRAAESNIHDNDNSVGQGLNKGILYLLSLPYIIGAIGAFAWYSEKRRKKLKSAQ